MEETKQITRHQSVRVAQILSILNNAATNDLTITQACEEVGISPRTFNRWYDDRKDEIITILETMAIARVQEITQLAQIRQQGIQTLLARISRDGTETKDVLAILKYVGAELETALTASGSYDESQEKQAQEYAKSLRGPQLQETDNRFVLRRERSVEETDEIDESILDVEYTDL